jgi:small subunit ribosomal protein S8
MDNIANMLNTLKNGNIANKDVVYLPYSKVKFAIATCLQKAGYVGDINKKVKKGISVIEVALKYETTGSPRIHGVTRVSKPSRRLYSSSKELKSFMQGFGNTIVSTPKGILTEKEAKKELVGGEVLFNIW